MDSVQTAVWWNYLYLLMTGNSRHCNVMNTAHHFTAHHFTAHHYTANNCTLHHCIAHNCTALHCSPLSYTPLHYTWQQYTSLHCTALNCWVVPFSTHHILVLFLCAVKQTPTDLPYWSWHTGVNLVWAEICNSRILSIHNFSLVIQSLGGANVVLNFSIEVSSSIYTCIF